MKGIKKLLGLGMVVSLTLGVVGCSSGNKNSDVSKLDQIKENGKIVLATSADYPPYEFPVMEDGKEEIVGFDVSLVEEIAKEIGVKVEIQNMDFDGLLGALNADKADIVMAGMTPDETRKKAVDFSDLYYEGKNVVIVNKGDEDKIKSADDLKKLKIGVQRGSTQETLVTQELKAENVTSLPKTPDLMTELKNKNIDAIVIGNNVAEINIANYDNLVIANTDAVSKSDESSAIAFKKSESNKELIELVNKKIKELKDNGKIDEMMNKALKLSGE